MRKENGGYGPDVIKQNGGGMPKQNGGGMPNKTVAECQTIYVRPVLLGYVPSRVNLFSYMPFMLFFTSIIFRMANISLLPLDLFSKVFNYV